MPLERLIYASRSTRPFSDAEMTDLVRPASVRNRAAGITGLLVYCDGFFLQWLEGGTVPLRATFDRVRVDSRHRDVHEFSCRPVPGRAFAEWGMSFLHETAARPVDLNRIRSITSRLQSLASWDEMGEPAAALIQDLKSAITRLTRPADPARAA